jgi:hypothetical protein
MKIKQHKKNTRDFGELTFSEQAKSINAEILYLKRAVQAHVRRGLQDGRDATATLQKCERQFSTLAGWIHAQTTR